MSVNFCCTAKWVSYTYIYILFHILFHYGLSQDIDYHSLCYQWHSWCHFAVPITLTHWPFLLHCLRSASINQHLLGFHLTPRAALSQLLSRLVSLCPSWTIRTPWGSDHMPPPFSASLPDGSHCSSSFPHPLPLPCWGWVPRSASASELHFHLLYRQLLLEVLQAP